MRSEIRLLEGEVARTELNFKFTQAETPRATMKSHGGSARRCARAPLDPQDLRQGEAMHRCGGAMEDEVSSAGSPSEPPMGSMVDFDGALR